MTEEDYVFYIGFHNGQLNNPEVTDEDQKVIPCKIKPKEAGKILRAIAEVARTLIHKKRYQGLDKAELSSLEGLQELTDTF